jgi:hypothetical protein
MAGPCDRRVIQDGKIADIIVDAWSRAPSGPQKSTVSPYPHTFSFLQCLADDAVS